MSDKKIYILQHSYYYENGNPFGIKPGYEEIKMLGLYSSREKAEDAIEAYALKEGFNLYGKECFHIDSYEIDCDTGWKNGFECRDDEYWLPIGFNTSKCTGPGSEYSKIKIWEKHMGDEL